MTEPIFTKDTPDAVLKEEIIQQTYTDENKKELILELRRIGWWDAQGQRVYEFITNNMELDAAMKCQAKTYFLPDKQYPLLLHHLIKLNKINTYRIFLVELLFLSDNSEFL